METETVVDLNVYNDALIKSLFVSREARAMIVKFLAKLTPYKREELIRARANSIELPKINVHHKGHITDVIFEVDKKNYIIIEINSFYYKRVVDKNANYVFTLAVIKRTKENPDVNIYLINIDKFRLNRTKKGIQLFSILDAETGKICEVDTYRSIHFTPCNILKNEYNKDKYLTTFARFMEAKSLSELKRVSLEGGEEFMFAYEKVASLMDDPNQLLYYDYEEMKNWELEQVREDSLVEGKASLLKTMYNNGMSLDNISKSVSIPLETVKQMLEQEE